MVWKKLSEYCGGGRIFLTHTVYQMYLLVRHVDSFGCPCLSDTITEAIFIQHRVPLVSN